MKLKRWMKATGKINENRNLKWKTKGTFLREQILDWGVKWTLLSWCFLITTYLLNSIAALMAIDLYFISWPECFLWDFFLQLLIRWKEAIIGEWIVWMSLRKGHGKKRAKLRDKIFEFASHEAAESHLYQLALYSFFPSQIKWRKQSSISNEPFSLWRFMSLTKKTN